MPITDERLKKPSHQTSAFKNPCLKEQGMSLKCLEENHYKRDKCITFFENYINCQKFWTKVRNERRAQGIEPYMPFPEEREKIKAEYMKNRKS